MAQQAVFGCDHARTFPEFCHADPHAPEPPEVFRATSAMLPTQPGSIASARAPDPGPSRRCPVDARNAASGSIAERARGLSVCARGERASRADTRAQSVVRRFGPIPRRALYAETRIS